MDKGEELQSGRVIDDREDYLVDRDRGVCDPFLSIGSVYVSKEILWYCGIINPFYITSPLNKPSISQSLQNGVLLTTPLLRELS